MIDVSPKFKTLRYAMAKGTLRASAESIHRIAERTVPKGDVLEVARAAGILAAKKCADIMVFCHSLPLDWVDLRFEFEQDAIKVFCEARTVWKTGVEMEALAGVNGALLNMYDMLKPIDENIALTDIKLVKKRGGKSNFRDGFAQPIRAAVLIISDSTFAGTRVDKSGKLIADFLSSQPVDVRHLDVLPDEKDQIASRLIELVDEEEIQLIFTSGGTGPGPRDVTPEATREVLDLEMPGISEAMRKHGKDRMPYAMLSRQVSGFRKNSLIVNFPGSSKGVKESLASLFPGILHVFPMRGGGGHDDPAL